MPQLNDEKRNRALLESIIRRQGGGAHTNWLRRHRRKLEWTFIALFVAVVGFMVLETPSLTSVFPFERVTNRPFTPSSDLTGPVTVVDGDTLDMRGIRIRLWGIDAPEGSQTCTRDGQAWLCGRDAAAALAAWIGGRTAQCEKKDTDRYGRIVARCFIGGSDVSGWLAESGWALAFRRYTTFYVANEQRAKGMRAGIWSGEFIPPWEYRAAQPRR